MARVTGYVTEGALDRLFSTEKPVGRRPADAVSDGPMWSSTAQGEPCYAIEGEILLHQDGHGATYVAIDVAQRTERGWLLYFEEPRPSWLGKRKAIYVTGNARFLVSAFGLVRVSAPQDATSG